MTEPLTRDQVRGLLREIVAEFREGYSYMQVPWQDSTACVYTVDGCPSCLIGHLLHRLNVTVAEYRQTMPIHLVAKHDAPGVFTPMAVYYMANVQRYQDAGASWAECLEIADRVTCGADF